MGRQYRRLGPLMGVLLGLAVAPGGVAVAERAEASGGQDADAPSAPSWGVGGVNPGYPGGVMRPARPTAQHPAMMAWPGLTPWGGAPLHRSMPGRQPFAMPVYDAAGLTPPQRAQVRDVRRAARLQHHQLRDELLQVRSALEDALLTPKPEPEAVGAVFARYFDIQRRMIELRLRTVNAIAEIVQAVEAPSAAQRGADATTVNDVR